MTREDAPLSFPEWTIAPEPLAYDVALADMEARAAAIYEGQAPERIWLIEHPPLYTAGTSADVAELLDPRFPVYDAGRGGRYTYHGPGQRVGYVQLNLAQRGKDVRCYVHALEGWVIDALADFGVAARRAEGRIGIWTDTRDGREAKIGAIGVRVRRWVNPLSKKQTVSSELVGAEGYRRSTTGLRSAYGLPHERASTSSALTVLRAVFYGGFFKGVLKELSLKTPSLRAPNSSAPLHFLCASA